MDENAPVNFDSPPPVTPPPVAPAPPPRMPPPPIIAAPAAAVPPPRKSRGWMVVALLAIALLMVSMLINVGHFIHGFGSMLSSKGKAGHSLGHLYEERVIEDNESDNKIAVIDVQGVISSQMIDGGRNMVTMFKDQLDMAKEDHAVKAVILKVDSPGGEVLAADDMARAIMDFHEQSDKPVIVAMEGLAASGGYYISAPCQWIVANELTITGSIGVIMESYNYRGLMDKVGVSPMVFKSGKFKDMLSGEKSLEETLPEERQMVQALIDETFSKFKQVVADGREQSQKANKGAKDKGRVLAENWRDYADGRILSGKQAYDLGFVDELGSFEVAVKRAEKIAGVNDANLVQYHPPFDISNLFHLFGKTEAPTLKIDLGMDRPKLQVGRLYFMSSSVLH